MYQKYSYFNVTQHLTCGLCYEQPLHIKEISCFFLRGACMSGLSIYQSCSCTIGVTAINVGSASHTSSCSNFHPVRINLVHIFTSYNTTYIQPLTSIRDIPKFVHGTEFLIFFIVFLCISVVTGSCVTMVILHEWSRECVGFNHCIIPLCQFLLCIFSFKEF